jgi:uncharacterized membrane protein
LAVTPYSERRRIGGAAALLGAGVLILAVGYPIVLPVVEETLGTRGLALAMLVLLLAALPWRVPGRGVATGGVALLVSAAALSGDERFLRAVPAWVYAGLAGVFAVSLRGRESIIERAARWIVPQAPAFIREYCRVVTALWAVFFAGSALAISWLAVAATAETWRVFTSRWLWLAMGVLSVLEFFVRKTWFRYYPHHGPFDRVWSRLFPAERTARGRASMRALAEHYGEPAGTGPSAPVAPPEG